MGGRGMKTWMISLLEDPTQEYPWLVEAENLDIIDRVAIFYDTEGCIIASFPANKICITIDRQGNIPGEKVTITKAENDSES